MMTSILKNNLPVVIAVSGGTALIATYLYQKNRESCKQPPGPLSFPLVGNLFQLSVKRTYIPGLFNRWADQYGPIYLVDLGSVSAIVLNSMCVISDAFEDKAHIFSDRPNWLPLINMIYQQRGITWQNGDGWQELRHCAGKAMSGCGLVCESLEERIQYELRKLIREFSQFEQDCCTFCPCDLLHKAVANIISSITFGCRFKYDSTRFDKFLCQIHYLAECNILDSTTFFPFLSNLPLPHLKAAVSNMEEIVCFIEQEICRHRESFDPTRVRDFIDLYLKEVSGGGHRHEDMCKKQIEVAITDLFVCGVEPVSTALSWALLCMSAFPDIQRRCHDDIDSAVCGGRLPEFVDAEAMPYVQATLHEVLRRFTILPLGIPHSVQQESTLCGYKIPCETVVICNHQAVHMNETCWNNPCEFDPERFLDYDCDTPRLVPCINNFIPFGIGPRSCAGKNVAMDILFLLFTGLLQRYEFQKACDCDLSKCFEGKYNFTFSPLPYQIKLRVHC